MNRIICLAFLTIALVGCNDDDVSVKPSVTAEHTVKPQGPVTITYNIIGTPIVGQPLAIDIQVDSTASNEKAPSLRQVRITPLREGRLFLNVSATVETDGGSISTVMAIPVQVGKAIRQVQENGEVTTDENGELIRVLPAD